MRFISYKSANCAGLAAANQAGEYYGLTELDDCFPGHLLELLQKPELLSEASSVLLGKGNLLNLDLITFLPVIPEPGKIICIGLNYVDHSAESGFSQPTYPTLFSRFNSSLVAHRAPLIRPRVSEQLDFEGELVAVIGKGGRGISTNDALTHVAGYSIFNDASIRDYQLKSPQWTVGKNFDGTGALGPSLVTADELPVGCKGLHLETRLNGQVMQRANIDDMVFSVAAQISIISEAITLQPGDILVTGTPSGVGMARKPPVWMKPGDICEVQIDSIGMLSNQVQDQQ